MPNYGYKCNNCGNEFEEYVHTREQANCEKAVPNSKRAICPECHQVANRNFMGTRLYKYGGNIPAMIADLKGVPDPAFDGKVMVNAGRNYGVAVKPGPPEKQPDDKPRFTLLHYFQCNCSICSPKSV